VSIVTPLPVIRIFLSYPILCRETDKGKFATTDNFIHCEEIIQKSEYLVVTNYRLMYVQRNEMFGVWTVSFTANP